VDPTTSQRRRVAKSRCVLAALLEFALLSVGCDHAPATPSDSVTLRPFRLTLRVADACPPFFSRIDSPREFTFHGSLKVDGRKAATFMLPPKDVTRPNTGDLAVDILRLDASRLSGSIHSSFSLDQIGYIVAIQSTKDQNGPVTFVGSESIDGRMTGQFDAFVHVVHYVFSISDSCAAPGFSLGLTPE
jgi:hypothetical protein